MKTELKIVEVLDNETNKRCKRFGYRVGRECYIDSEGLDIGSPLVVYYLKGGYWISTKIQDIEENEYCLSVKTKNRTYIFEENDRVVNHTSDVDILDL